MFVNVCGIPHKVIETKDAFDESVHLGQINYKECVIYLNEALPGPLKDVTLCHEIIHGILVHIGREDLSEDETLVTALGTALAQSFDVKEYAE